MTRVVKILALMFFGAPERQRVWNKLATQIENRMSLEESLLRLYEHAHETKSPHEEIYDHIIKTLGHGRTLGEALTGLATQEEIELIQSAQNTGKLAEGLRFASKILDAKGRIKKSLVQNLSSPVMMLVACIAMMGMISTQVIPQLAMISDPEKWEGASWLLYIICSFIMSTAGAVTGITIVVGIIVVWLSFKRCTGRKRRFLDKHLPWSIYRMSVGTGWLYTIAIRMSAGHQLAKILESMVRTPSRYLREIVEAILAHSRHGEDFGLALQASQMHFPSSEIVDDLRIYAKMPGFQNHIMELADSWLKQGVEEVQKLAEKIGYAIYALIIGQIVLVALVASNFQNQVNVGV